MCPVTLSAMFGTAVAGTAAAGTAAAGAAAAGTAAAGAAAATTAVAASTIPWAAIVSGIGVGVSALGQMRQGNASAANFANQSQMADYNAKVSRQNAQFAIDASQADADTIDRQRRIALANQAVSYAGGGVVIGEGSTLEVLGDTAAEFELDRLNTLHKGELQKRSQLIAATQGEAQSGGLLAQASQAKSSGVTSALTTAAKGAFKISESLPKRTPSVQYGYVGTGNSFNKSDY